jgi:RNA polymerase sigma factor (sigma-70 family)
MEAARTLTDLPERIRMRRFTAACEELRPLGVAYVLRQFGQSLGRADAEDAVAEVIIRFHRLASAGRPPDRLRPAFFSSVRNAALDLLRYRGIRPTAPLEAAASKTTEGAGPEEQAESHEDLVRLREAMARMRPNYREAIVLRFGLDLSVPQIAAHLGISLPAAKKLVLRSTAQIRDRIEAIDGSEFCPEMRGLARQSVLDGEIAGLSDQAESAAIRAHLEHCGPCRGFLASLRADLHELGSSALLGGLAAGKLGVIGRLLSGFHGAAQGVHAGVDRVRLASYRASGALAPDGGSSAGLLAGTGQKLAVLCTAGAASAATCLATGIVGPGLAVGPAHHVDPHPTPPPAHVRKAAAPRRDQVHLPDVSYSPPESEAEATVSEVPTAPAPRPRGTSTTTRRESKPTPTHRTEPEPEPTTPSQTEQSEFGFEGEASAEASTPAPTEAAAPLAASRSVETTASTATSTPEASSSGNGGSGSGGHDEFGFGG